MAFSVILDLFASSTKKLILKKIEDFVLLEIKNKIDKKLACFFYIDHVLKADA